MSEFYFYSINPAIFQTTEPSITITGDIEIGQFKRAVREKYGVFPIRVFDSRGKEYKDFEHLSKASEFSYMARPIIMQEFKEEVEPQSPIIAQKFERVQPTPRRKITNLSEIEITLSLKIYKDSNIIHQTIKMRGDETVADLKDAIWKEFNLPPSVVIIGEGKRLANDVPLIDVSRDILTIVTPRP